ncbi:NAD-dependent epimerase/dehydratase family protein [Elusimicrobiota bacterium]
MKILITGGNGFLGKHLTPKLKSKGHETLIPRSKEMDLMDHKSTLDYINACKPDAVYHLAAYYGGLGITVKEPANIFFKNTIMTANLFEACVKAGVKKILPTGSACSYPGGLAGDMKEDGFWDGRCHESVEAYGFSKKLQVVGLAAYRKQYGISFNHLVLTNLYGEWDEFGEYRSHAISALIKRFCDAAKADSPEVACWGSGTPIREFLYAGDAAEAFVRALDLGHNDEPINIGTGIGTSIRELTDMVSEASGYKGRIVWDSTKPDGVARKVLDIEKMKDKLKWEPPTKLKDGLARTIKWYKANN